MIDQFEPSAEMIEAAGDALVASGGLEIGDGEVLITPLAIRAALAVVIPMIGEEAAKVAEAENSWCADSIAAQIRQMFGAGK